MVSGLLVLAPIVATYLILRLIFNFLLGLMKPLIDFELFNFVPDQAVRWVALGALVVGIYLVGILATKVFSGRIIGILHQIMETIPMVRVIYRLTRQATEVLAGTNSQFRYRRVVLVDFPREGLKTVGLVTGRLKSGNGRDMVMLYIPTAPNPTSGFTALVYEDDVIPTDMTIEDAMKLVVSGGVVFPSDMGKYSTREGQDRPSSSGQADNTPH